MTSDLASATVTVAGGGLLLAKNCAIILLRKALKPTKAPTKSASSSPTTMNQRSIRTGRARGFSPIGRPEIWLSVTMFMSCAFCNRRLPRIPRQLAVQIGGNRGFVEPNSAEYEFTKLPFETGGVAVIQARCRWQPRQCRHQQGVMRKPEQVQRLAPNLPRIARLHRARQRCGEDRSDQHPDFLIDQPSEFAIVEVAGEHQPQTLGLLLI